MPENPSGALPSSHGIASLRWRVTLYRRDQAPGANSGIDENLVLIATVQADVQPTYPTTHYGSAQVDMPITHMIRVRWLDYVENTHIVMRSTRRPTDDTFRTELFRVRRVKEIGGRKRFCELECELEYVKTTAGDTDAERQMLFAENGMASVH
jgi:hypothetical protein